MRVDVNELGADFLAFSAHKHLAHGVGVLVGTCGAARPNRPRLHRRRDDRLRHRAGRRLGPVPEKFEAGTQDAAGIYATGVALDYLVNKVAMTSLPSVSARRPYAMSRMVELPFVNIIGSIYWDQHHGAISFNIRGIHPHDVASIMDMDGVCIRAGHHCAQPLLTWLGVENLACCRASLAFYNDKYDIDRFTDSLNHVWSVFNG